MSADLQNLRDHEIIKYISRFATISDEEAKIILNNLCLQYYKKGEIILREGQTSDLSYFIIKGCVRQYYIVNDEEKTTNFFMEGQPLTLFDVTYKKNPSKFYLACVEDCTLSVGSNDIEPTPQQQELYSKFVHVCNASMEEEACKYQEAFSMYLITTPEERYVNLLKTNPKLVDRVPQYQLANYLGITAESLSRIRKRISQKKL